MIGDVLTVMWKEGVELFAQRGNRRSGLLGMLMLVGVLGIYGPIQAGRGWVTTPVSLVYWAWMPLFLVSTVVADSFAGERERHTLETLLATRLPDRAILFGKVGAAVAYGWGFTVLVLLLGLIAVNAAHGHGELLIYPAVVVLGGTLLSLLAATLAAGAGVLVSLRAATVRQAQQTMSFAVVLLVFVPIFGLQALPIELRNRLLAGLMTMTGVPTQIVLVVAVVFLVLDLVILSAAMARFQRSRLIS